MQSSTWLEILTERLRLRPLRPDDVEALAAVYQHPLVAYWIGESTREDVEREIARQIEQQTSLGYSFWAVEARKTGRMVGDCGLQPLEHRGPEIELGYDLHPDVWGRGLATEAARGTLRAAFGAMQLDRVIAVAKPEHLASQRVLVKAGLRHTGQREAYEMPMLVYEAERDARDPAQPGGCVQRENHLA